MSQEAEVRRDFGDSVLVDAVQPDQGVEDQQTGRVPLDGLHEPLPVGLVVEAQDGHVDDRDVEGLEVGAGRRGDALEVAAHDVAGVLGGEHQHWAGLHRREAGNGAEFLSLADEVD